MYFKICFGFKECEDNYFGQNCRERCNETCRSCNKTTGVCDSGCYPGWRGLYCQQGKTFSLIMLKVTSTVTSRWKQFHVICPVNCGFSRQFRFFVKSPILTRGNLWFNHFVNVGFYDELKILSILRKRESTSINFDDISILIWNLMLPFNGINITFNNCVIRYYNNLDHFYRNNDFTYLW